jgi:hypothetical protein
MDELLTRVLDAHGGLENWSKVTTLTARLSLGGPFWEARGWPGIYDNSTAQLDAHREHIAFTPFTTPDRKSVLDVESQRVAILSAAGDIVEERENPRRSFPLPFELATTWDALQVAYFAGYANWNYLTTPFLFTYPGVEANEIDPWEEDGETWRRLKVTFPKSIATHNTEQFFYFDSDHMLRRMDYSPDVTGAPPVAHYAYDHQEFDGFIFPTKRDVHRRDAEGIADKSQTAITIAIESVAIQRA